jgi:hypothetical protein
MSLLLRRWVPLAITLGAGAVAASTLEHWGVMDLARRSSAIVQGHVFRMSAHWSADGMKILTDVDIRVAAVWKGQVGESVRVTQLGGVIEGLGQRVDGMAAFANGEEVVVFLEPQGTDRFSLTGMGQGKFRVDRSRGVMAIPEALSGTVLVDPKTHQKLSEDRRPIPLELLRAHVQATLQGIP